MLSLFTLILGFSLLIWGADHFVYGASSLAQKLRIPSLIIGLTIVAFGTSAPELAVSVTAGLSGANEIALGNVLGSNLFNLLVVVGASALFRPLFVEKELLHRDWTASIISTILLFLLTVFDMEISFFDSCIFLLGFATIMFLQINSAKKNTPKSENESSTHRKMILIALDIVAGLCCIILGGQFSVSGATDIALMFGISETIIGLTIVAIGTSLPELVTSVIATKKGETSIAIGNVIGSNLFNILFILGVSCAIKPIPVLQTGIYDMLILATVSLIMFFIGKANKINRLIGIFMISIYAIYTFWIIFR